MNSDMIILVIIIGALSYFALDTVTNSIDNVNSSSFVVTDDREFNYNVSVDCENCSNLYVSRTGDNVTGDFNFSDTVFIREDGTVNAVVYEGDGSPLTGVGEAAATALTMSGRTTEIINKGQCVYIAGATGTTADVSLCDNTHIDKHSMFGIAAESKTQYQPILLRIRGELTSVDTSGYAENATLYMSTAGDFVTSAPASGAIVMCGHVVNVHVSNGVIVVDDLLDHEVGAADNEDYTHRLGATANYIMQNSTNGVIAQWYDNANFTALQGRYEFLEPIITDGSQLYDVNFTETDTLQSVTDRNSTTTNNITTLADLNALYCICDGSQITNLNCLSSCSDCNTYFLRVTGGVLTGALQIKNDFTVTTSTGLAEFWVMGAGNVYAKGTTSMGTYASTNILTVKQTSSTDPIADAWTVYSTPDTKIIKGTADTEFKQNIDLFRNNMTVWKWQRKKSNKLEYNTSASTELLYSQYSNLKKFSVNRYGLIADNNTPNFLKSYDENNKVMGIDLYSYIGFLHEIIRYNDVRIQTLTDEYVLLKTAFCAEFTLNKICKG